jgi:hypothetical protein
MIALIRPGAAVDSVETWSGPPESSAKLARSALSWGLGGLDRARDSGDARIELAVSLSRYLLSRVDLETACNLG